MRNTIKLHSTAIAVAFTLAGVLGVSAMASAEVDKDNLNPWQHCGIGAAIFDKNETAAALSNVIWDSGTTAVTSATLSPDTCESEQVQVAQFIDETYDVLAMETAVGEGEHLQTALTLAGCAASTQEDVIGTLRTDLGKISADTRYGDMSHSDKAYEFYRSLTTASGCSVG
nr:DUF3015 family protein [uncultured Halomonas sp.]